MYIPCVMGGPAPVMKFCGMAAYCACCGNCPYTGIDTAGCIAAFGAILAKLLSTAISAGFVVPEFSCVFAESPGIVVAESYGLPRGDERWERAGERRSPRWPSAFTPVIDP